MKRVLIVASQHGNELLGERVHAHLAAHYPELLPMVDYVLANPRARAANVRYVESDMNRSYDPSATGYEAERAQTLRQQIIDGQYDMVLDMHTTTVKQPPCIITPEVDGEYETLIRPLPMRHIVVMRHEFVQRSLIGNVPRALSIEVSSAEVEGALDGICQAIAAYGRGDATSRRRRIYAVTALLKKIDVSEMVAERLVNFRRAPDGYYPVLAGENSYKQQTDYLGFRADTLELRDI
jgi:aspartoacylase